MTAPLNPPPANEAGAILQPRQLQRWLDVNPVNKLTRTQTYFTLPAMEDFETPWLGYSQIVAAYNFTATNNFSLAAGFEVPDDVNFVACIMWVDEDYNVFRYKLWQNVGEVFYFDAPLYAGQLIKKNFRIEIWDAEITPVAALTIFRLNGAGTAAANGQYDRIAGPAWIGDTYTISLVGNTWQVDGANLYSISSAAFPLGIWTDGAGASPAPYGSVGQVMIQTDAVIFYTSVAGNYDYIWQYDNSIATAGTMITDFGYELVGGSWPLALVWPFASVPALN